MSLLGEQRWWGSFEFKFKTSTRSLDERMLGYSENLAKKTEFEALGSLFDSFWFFLDSWRNFFQPPRNASNNLRYTQSRFFPLLLWAALGNIAIW